MQLQDAQLLRHDAYIDGRWCQAETGQCFVVSNPATGELLAEVSDLDETDTQRAILAAHAAWPAWRTTPADTRAALLKRWFALIHQHAEDLAQLITAEQGKPLAEARAEISYAASFVEWFAEEARRVCGDVISSPSASQRLLVLKQAVGVCALITPWNFPAAMITRKAAAALAAGCTLLIKPAEQTPLSALALAELAVRAGFPAGVFNVLTASASHTPAVGAALCASPMVRKLSFTGSTAVGRLLMAQCAPSIKKLSLELGGNAPFMVFDDADLDAAVAGAMHCKFRNNGQTCISANRFLLQAGIHDAFVERLMQHMQRLRVGAGLEPTSDLGPLIDAAARDKLTQHIDAAVSAGAQLRLGGQPHALGGNYYSPTLLTEVSPDMLCAREENFGPLAAVLRFTDEAQAVTLANASDHGLAGYFYTRDSARIWRLAEALEYGMLGINSTQLSNAVGPFGGIKQSGLGREGSKYGLDEYLELKYLSWNVG